ncbi:hypothetical protein TorRG33x02_276340 [Trema orientale]|uniref:Uncharacterized protein n=1 Tax=Trema orientale TaxID=63057 RepID=A0A2P5CQQ5_TREOI|nr:hypothetical protein TorRG33x02_276340 [Trema orientale]
MSGISPLDSLLLHNPLILLQVHCYRWGRISAYNRIEAHQRISWNIGGDKPTKMKLNDPGKYQGRSCVFKINTG